MNEQTWINPNCDRTQWSKGEWDDEPDKVQWTDEETGLVCLAKRNPHMGNWCGYVGVAPEHPMYGKDYNDVDADVHGGLTYADSCQEGPLEMTICHIPESGSPDHLWWLGFDCGHADDVSPNPLMKYHSLRGTYKTLDYVREQCKELAKQLV